MKTTITLNIISILFVAVFGCAAQENRMASKNDEVTNHFEPNFKSKELKDFVWMNKPEVYEIKKGTLKIMTKQRTDFFNNPEDLSITSTAPFLFKEVRGDFVAKTLVRPDFSSQWNAAALMVHIDSKNWIKFAFENSDATGKSIVTVVTKDVSDDANGVILNSEDQIWLKIARKNNNYSMFWSADGENFKMARLTAMIPVETVKIGMEVQSPIGESAMHEIDYFEIIKSTVTDLRKGN